MGTGCSTLCYLSYKFIATPSDQLWYKIQVNGVNGSTFLHYTCYSEKVKLISVPEMKENATQAWDQQRDSLKCMMEELKNILTDILAEIIATSDPLSLQGSTMCKQESNALPSASWEFGFDGQIISLL